MIKLSIILVNYNTFNDTETCIKSLLENNNGYFDLKLIVVDNNSKKEIHDKLINLSNDLKFNLISNNDNYGFAKANNIGLQYTSDSDYIWFLNNDTKIEKGFFERLYQKLPNDNEVLYFSMYDFNKSFVNDGLNYVSLRTGIYSETKKKGYIPYIVGASIFLKNTTKVPRWDEQYFLYYEDVEYSISLLKNGYFFKNIPELYYLHKINGSSGCNPKTNFFRIQSQKKFMKKHGKNYAMYFLLKCFYYALRFKTKELKAFLM